MDNSMEQRFVDRLLHVLATMADNESKPTGAVVVPVAVKPTPVLSPIKH